MAAPITEAQYNAALKAAEGAFPDLAASQANQAIITNFERARKDEVTAAEINAATQAATDAAPIRTLQNVADQSVPTIITQVPPKDGTENRPQGKPKKPKNVVEKIRGLDETIREREELLRSF